jgi:hemerythrin-like metal-binding protein
MTDDSGKPASPRVIVIADVEANAQALVKRVLTPAGVQSWVETAKAPPCDVLVVDVTQLRGDPLAGLRARRDAGDLTPAIVLAAHFSPARIRDLFRLNVGDVLLKPYRPEDLVQAIGELAELRSAEANTQVLSRKLDTLREQFKRRSDEVRTLSEIGRAVVSLGDLDAILARVAEAAAFLSDAEEANIYLAEPGTSELVLRASKQAGEKHASLQRLRVYDTLVGQVFQTGQPLLHQPSLEGGTVKVQTGFLVQSLIEVPLRVGNRTVGVLGVFNRLAAREFTNHQLTLMQALADTRDGDYGSRLLDIHTHLLRHCADEERWMRESAFPDYEGHRREHDTLLEVVSEVRRRCDAGDVEIVARLADELPAWFEVHGNTMDAALAFHLKLHTQAQREADRDPLLAA